MVEAVTGKFGNFKLVNESSMSMKFQVPREVEAVKVTFSDLFKFGEKLKEDKLITDYSVCETTFEDIFQYFAKKNSLQAEEEALALIN